MPLNILKSCRSSLQFKLFLSLTAIVALSLTAILASQVYLVQDYFIQQAESNLRSSNYLLSRVLADPLFSHDLSLLQTRLHDVQTKLPLCNFQLKDNIGTVVFRVGEVKSRSDTEFNPNSSDGCYNTVIPVIHENQLLGTVRMGVRTNEISQARDSLIQQSAFFALFWFAIFMLPFFIQIRRFVRPLGNLSAAAQQFAKGNLDYPTPPLLHGVDEVSQLTTSFQGMAQALVLSRDIQAANLAELNNEKSTLDALLATMPVGVIFVDRNHILYCNDAFRRLCLLGPNEQLVGMKNDTLLLRIGQIATEADSFLRDVEQILETRELTEPKYVRLKDGRTLSMISNVVNDPNSSGYLWRFWLFEDVTEEKRILQLAEKHGEQDALTLLHNRHRYDKDLLLLMAQAERDGARIALLVFDLDDFKPVNDLYGHAAGDVVLRQVAHTLTAQLRRNEVLYRIGGDEFSLVLINASDDEIKMLAERIVTTIDQLDFTFDGEVAYVGCSLGIARYPNDANTLQKLQQYADQAMYVAKKMGKGQFSFNNVIHDAWRELEQPVAELPFNEMALGISIMDAQHIAVAHFIHGIIDSLMSGDKTTKLLKRVDMLIELCQINFQTEEDLMKRHDIPGVENYRADHQQRLASLRAIFGKLNFSEEQLPALARETNDWLLDHIRSQDKELASQLRKLGVS